MSARPLFALPDTEQRFAVFALSTVFALQFGLCYAGASQIAQHVPWRMSVGMPLDESIPFLPGAAVLYLAITPILLCAPFILRDLPSLLPFFMAVSLETAVATVLFIVLPVGAPEPKLACIDAASCMFTVADSLNLSGNNVPSLHVALVLTSALAFSPRVPVGSRHWLWLICAAVVASTLLTKQHRIVDVATGALLGWAGWVWARHRASQAAIIDRFDVELLCWQNYAQFVGRGARYLTIVVALLVRSAGRYRERRVLRTGFCFLQAVDDVLDGDRRSQDDPLEVTDRLVRELRCGQFGEASLSRLARAFSTDLEARGGRPAIESAIALIRNMQADRRRASERSIWTQAQLESHHRETFGLSVDLLMCANGNSLRSAAVPELLDAFGWCSTVRDLEDDLGRGLVNLPREILGPGDLAGCELRSLAGRPAVVQWLHNGALRTLLDLDQTRTSLAQQSDRNGAKILEMFARSIRRYAVEWAAIGETTAAQSPDGACAPARRGHPRPTNGP